MTKRLKPKSDQEVVAISRSLISEIMSEMGKKGGKISGARRIENIPAEKRSEIALKAARARWDKRKKTGTNVVR